MAMTVNSVERGEPATEPAHQWSSRSSVARGDAPKLCYPGHFLCRLMNNRSQNGDDEADQRRSAALIGLIIILALAIAGVWLVRELREKSQLEDCLMSGRTNCAPIEAPARR
jgi:hypothetical protein